MSAFQPFEDRHTHCGYGAGHPWYYLLGGAVLTPEQIKDAVRRSGYRGYLAEDINRADLKPEPQRTQSLRRLRSAVLDDFYPDLRLYGEKAAELRSHRRDEPPGEACVCAPIHTAISLKHNHLVNHFAHLNALEAALSRQLDLFSF